MPISYHFPCKWIFVKDFANFVDLENFVETNFREFPDCFQFCKIRENQFSRKFLLQKFVHANFSTFKVFDAPIKTLLSNFQNFIWEKSLTPFGSETQGKGVQKFSILRWRHFWIMAPYEMKNLTQKIVGTLTSEVEGRRRCCSTSRLFSPFSQKREILTCCWVQTKSVWSDMQNRLQQWLFTL